MVTARAIGCLAVLSVVGSSNALTVGLLGTGSNELPEFALVAGGSSPLEIVLELRNEQAVDSPPVVLWQLSLNLAGNAAAVGEVFVQSVSPPNGSLFGSNPGPTPLGGLPASEVVVSDVDASPKFAGVVIPAQSAAPIAELSLTASSDADGEFALWATAFNPADTDHSSYWTNAVDFEPTAFDNSLANPPRIELATILVSEMQPLMGDFNNDLVVNAADYTVWRDGLHSVYMEEDYEIWKSHYIQTGSAGVSTVSVPEPESLILIGLLCPFAVNRERRRRVHSNDRKLRPSAGPVGQQARAIAQVGSLRPGRRRPKSTKQSR